MKEKSFYYLLVIILLILGGFYALSFIPSSSNGELRSSVEELFFSPSTPILDKFLDRNAKPTGRILSYKTGDKMGGLTVCGNAEFAEGEQPIAQGKTVKVHLLPPESCSETTSKSCPPKSPICDDGLCVCRAPGSSGECENSGGHCDSALVSSDAEFGIGGCHINEEDVVGSCQDKTAESEQPYAENGLYEIYICCVLNSNPDENKKNQPSNTGVIRDPDASYPPVTTTGGDIPCGTFQAWRIQNEDGQLLLEKERVCVEWENFDCPIDKPFCDKNSCLCVSQDTSKNEELLEESTPNLQDEELRNKPSVM